MSRIIEVQNRLAPLLRDRARLTLTSIRGPANRLRNWIYFAQRYCAAADALEDVEGKHIHPRIQLYGHAVECALKAFLVAKQQTIPRGNAGHDLIKLTDIAEQNGCHVTEMQAIAIVQVSSLFYKDLGSNTAYKARYPTEKAESSQSIVGDFEAIHDAIESVCAQSGV